MVFGALIMNFILHVVEIILYYTDNQEICNSNDEV